MPKVKIGTQGVSIELEASETSIDALGKQALDLYRDACAIDAGQSTGPGFGLTNERRGEPMRGYHTEWHQPRPTQEGKP